MTDHEINRALARWMGWQEQPQWPYAPIPRGSFVVGQDPGSPPTIWRGLYPQSTHEPWSPLTDPAQTVEVMAKAAQRGWQVETRMSHWSAWATVSTLTFGRSTNQQGEGSGPWCRAVCLAVLAAAEDAR